MSIGDWLATLGLDEYTSLFERERIDLEAARHLTDANLKELGLPMGHRAKLLAGIAALDAATGLPPRREPGRSADGRARTDASQAERRQLTVMFCDLVGSTALTQALDPEQLRELMLAYQQVCGKVIEKYDGHVAQYLGDGLMVYFGWPKAHEDDAERAVRAGLEMVEAVKRVSAPSVLQVRVGVATGAVVVGETGGGDASIPNVAVGETPNLAARLQGLAGPDQIVIASATCRLLGVAFEYADLGENPLKGFVVPVRAFRILRAARTEGRFEATHAEALIPLVGREEEIGMLMRRWEHAKQGEGQVVLLSGEAGIGKSRIIQALRERVAGEPHTQLRYQCSPFHTNSALHPVIEQFERAAVFNRDDSAEQKLDKLEKLLREDGTDIPATAPLIAALLSLPAPRYPAVAYSPQKQKEKTLEALSAQVEGLSAKNPVLMVFEDAHWVDPTTQEALDLIVSRLAQHRVLLVMAYRAEYSSRWTGQPHVTTMTLSRLSRRLGGQMIRQVTGDKPLPDDVLEQILVKTDGVPLFVEELTKATLESGLLQDCGDRYELTGPLTALAIPSTLQDSLMARLDRFAAVKEVAQIGACIGREFPYELLSAVWWRGDRLLQEALDQLAQTELLSRRGSPPDAIYIFKHALVQDAAYDSLLKSNRQQLHTKIAQVLEERFPAIKDTEPELLARHCAAAGRTETAVVYWLNAAKRAGSRSAYREALGHVKAGNELLQSLPADGARIRLELQLQLQHATALQGSKGMTAPETGVAFAAARDLCNQLSEDNQEIFPALSGICAFHIARGELHLSLEVAREALRRAQWINEPAPRVIAHRMMGVSLLYRGELTGSVEHLEQVGRLYDPERDRGSASEYGSDSKAGGLAALSLALGVLGYPDRALAVAGEAVKHAEALGHVYTIVHTLALLYGVHVLRGEPELALGQAECVMALSERYGFRMQYVLAKASCGIVLMDLGETSKGADLIQESLSECQPMGNRIGRAGKLRRLAAAAAEAKRWEEAGQLLKEAVDEVEVSGERWVEAEIYRVKGECLLAQNGMASAAQAEACFHQSLDVARSQRAKSWELRTAISLARLWQSQVKRKEAHEVLASTYKWFTEGFDTKDLKEARMLLDQLS